MKQILPGTLESSWNRYKWLLQKEAKTATASIVLFWRLASCWDSAIQQHSHRPYSGS
jgi:hypothetical protein